MNEVDFLAAQVRGLERENRQLRSTLFDQYFCAAMAGTLAAGTFHEAAQIAARQTREMLEIRALVIGEGQP